MLSNHPSVLGSGGGTAYSLIGGTGLFADGTAAAPSISFANSTNMGLYRVGANDLGISVLGAYSFIVGSGGTLYGANGTARLTLPASGSVGLVAAGTNQNITLTPSGTGVVGIDGSVSVRNTQSINFAYPSDTTVATGKIGWWSGANVGVWINQSAANVLDFATNGGTALQILASRRALLGTATDSGALLQIGTDLTTRANGIVFGTDTFLHRFQAGGLTIDALTGQNPLLILRDNGSNKLTLQFSAGDGYLSTTNGGRLIFRTASNTDALTLDASQNSVFAGSVRAGNFTTAGAPPYAKGVIYFDTTLNKLRVGGATAFETITSV